MEKLDTLTRHIKPLFGWLQKQKQANRKRFTENKRPGMFEYRAVPRGPGFNSRRPD